MSDNGKPDHFPKLHSPFVRQTNDNGEYVVTSEIKDGYEWVFNNDEVRAVEKLDGTNTAITLDADGTVNGVFARMGTEDDSKAYREIQPFTETHGFIIKGVLNALSRGWIDALEAGTAHYGELIGPKINNNPYDLADHLFVPFDYLYRKVHYTSWGDYPRTYDAVSDWFADGLLPLFYARIHNIEFDNLPSDAYVEGIVFTHPDGRKAKLRVDMFDWYDGERH